MIRPATDRQVLILRLAARSGGDGAVHVPAADLRALLARLDHAEHRPDPVPIRLDSGQHSAVLDAWANDLNAGRPPGLPRWRPL